MVQTNSINVLFYLPRIFELLLEELILSISWFYDILQFVISRKNKQNSFRIFRVLEKFFEHFALVVTLYINVIIAVIH